MRADEVFQSGPLQGPSGVIFDDHHRQHSKKRRRDATPTSETAATETLVTKIPTSKEETKDEYTEMAEASQASSLRELQNALYAQCASQEEGKVFSQEEMLAFKIVPDNDILKLLSYTKQLAKDGLLKVMQREGKVCWRVVKKDDAAKYKALNSDEALVFAYIEASGREGMWSKILRVRTNLHMTTMNRAIKQLGNKNYIKSVKSVKFPSRKTYMLAKLQPSEDVTGGPFYADGILDDEFIFQMSYWTERYVIGRSWWHPPLPDIPQRGSHSKLTQEQAKALRAQELQRRSVGRERSQAMLPMPPYYNGYPTISEITKAINASKLSDITMKVAEMQHLVDILCWDGRLEAVQNREAYRAVRLVGKLDGESLGLGLTESPCGRCPVFDLCEEDGPVNARTCEYFHDWLQF